MWGGGGGGGGGAESVSLYHLSAYIRYTIEVSEQVPDPVISQTAIG